MLEADKSNDTPAQPGAPDSTVTPVEKIWAAAGPYVEKVLQAAIEAIERSSRHTGIVTGILLGLIILCLTGLAAFSMYLDKVDTAEKTIIALVSFLGGAAMFSGPPKK